ncbi:hypothetical protein [Acinetobacter baumannii]|uniref:hypothetical protein n=2 Tax=Acinetobacter baumannii TaxID=470 RepID=UPI003B42BDD1
MFEMDKCREEFEQYIRDQSGFTADFQVGPNGQYKSDLMHFMFAAFQHQQAKVEELQKQLSEYIFVAETIDEMYVKEVQKSDELQKRVDAALKLIESWNEIAFDKTTHWTEGYEEGCYHCAAQLEQALKGEGQ